MTDSQPLPPKDKSYSRELFDSCGPVNSAGKASSKSPKYTGFFGRFISVCSYEHSSTGFSMNGEQNDQRLDTVCDKLGTAVDLQLGNSSDTWQTDLF